MKLLLLKRCIVCDGLRTTASESSKASSSIEYCHLQGRERTEAASHNELETG